MDELDIDLTQIEFEYPEPIEIIIENENEIGDLIINPDVIFIKTALSYTHVLSQVDIDNKYIFVNELAQAANKSDVQIFIESVGLKAAFNIDYTITTDNKIFWQGYELESLLQINDVIKVYI